MDCVPHAVPFKAHGTEEVLNIGFVSCVCVYVCMWKGKKGEFRSDDRQQEEEHEELDNFYNQCFLFITKGKYIGDEKLFLIIQENDIVDSRLSFFLFSFLPT